MRISRTSILYSDTSCFCISITRTISITISTYTEVSRFCIATTSNIIVSRVEVTRIVNTMIMLWHLCSCKSY